MSIVINTNSSALIAANNLSYANQQLQKSLNRLSSGSKVVSPSDDAGGLAVSMKLTAASNRDADLQNNLSDATSYAQTQDGALQVAGSILDRMSQLATLNADPTKNTSDQANYNDEFTQLQDELTSLGSQTFNGVSLFGDGSLTVATTDDLSTSGAISVAQQDLLASAPFSPLSDNFANMDNWTDTSFGSGTSASVSGNALNLSVPGSGWAQATSDESFSGPFQITTDFKVSSNNGFVTVEFGNSTVTSLLDDSYNDGGTHTLKIDVDAAGNATAYVDGSATPADTESGIDVSSPSQITLQQFGGPGETKFGPIAITSESSVSGNVGAVASATSLGSLSLSTITGAIQDVATMRAENGAEQSRLGFASTMLTTNQTNLESAVSNITDVNVAAETTNLAKWNVLVQAGTSMLTQANQSAQIALKLITG